MSKLPTSPTYYKSLQLYVHTVATKGIHRSITLEEVSESLYDKSDSGRKTMVIRQELTVVEKGVLKKLSIRALKLVLSTIDDLYMNNALWHFEPSNSNERAAIKEMRDIGLLIRTEDAHIHYVNPLMIRRGSAASVLAQTTELLREVSRVHKTLIHDLNFKTVRFSTFDQLNLPMGKPSNTQPDE